MPKYMNCEFFGVLQTGPLGRFLYPKLEKMGIDRFGLASRTGEKVRSSIWSLGTV
jgi:hypothetical protein